MRDVAFIVSVGWIQLVGGIWTRPCIIICNIVLGPVCSPCAAVPTSAFGGLADVDLLFWGGYLEGRKYCDIVNVVLYSYNFINHEQ